MCVCRYVCVANTKNKVGFILYLLMLFRVMRLNGGQIGYENCKQAPLWHLAHCGRAAVMVTWHFFWQYWQSKHGISPCPINSR